jgi:hypothetical protein
MGLLTDLVMQKHKAQQDQIWREFDTYKGILMDPRSVEQGGFGDEQKHDALKRITELAAPSKKHAQTMLPILQHLTGIGVGSTPGDASSPSAGPSIPSGQTAPGAASSALATMAGLAPSPEVNQDPETYPAQPVMKQPAAPAAPAPTPTSQAGVDNQSQAQAPSPQPTPQVQPQPAQPAQPSMTDQYRFGQGIFAMPTLQDRQARQQQVADFNTDLSGREGLRGLPAQIEIQKQQREAQIAEYNRMIQGGFGPGAASVAFAGKNGPPSGFFTGQTRPVTGGAIQTGVDADGNKTTGVYTSNGVFHPTPGATFAPKTTSLGQEQRGDMLQAYADQLNTQHKSDPNWNPVNPETLTAQQRMDATSKFSGPIKNLVDAKRIVNDPNASPEEKDAAQTFIKGQELDQKKTEVQINVGENNIRNQGDLDDQAQNIAAAIQNGTQPPNLTGLQRNGLAGRVRSILAKQGFPMVEAEKDWQAVQAHIRTLNGPAIQKQVQAISTIKNTIPMVKEAYAKWRATGLPNGFSDYNSLALNAAARLPGQSGVAARELIRQVTDFSAELGSVYMQGNSNTDHSLDLAKQNLSANWNSQQFATALMNAEKFAAIRLNSIYNSGVVQSGQNRYDNSGQNQGGGGGQGGQGGQGESINGQTLGGYSYRERPDLQNYAGQFQEGQSRPVQEGGSAKVLKMYQGRIYEVQQAGGGGGRRGGR